MKTEHGYNGWKNYETWNVALWMDNDQGSYGERCERAEELYREAVESFNGKREDLRDECKSDAADKLADWLKDYIEEANPLTSQASVFSDLLGAALSEVDWYEIGQNWIEDVDHASVESDVLGDPEESDED